MKIPAKNCNTGIKFKIIKINIPESSLGNKSNDFINEQLYFAPYFRAINGIVGAFYT
jgi:hypothetical protein